MKTRWLAGALAAAVMVTGCASSGVPTPSTTALTESKTLTVVTHDSFNLPQALKDKFAAENGYQVKYIAPGDAGTVVNQLVLSKNSPIGDVVYGIDNTFAARAISEGVIADYTSAALPAGASTLSTGVADKLTPIDYGDVCINADTKWFAAKKLAVPQTFDDLTKPEYRNLLVISNPATSSPGLAFLMATVAAKGDPGYLEYGKALKANGMKVVSGWSDAYDVQFSGSKGKGSRPLVLSYGSSPAFEPATQALTKTCFRQVEYAGVINGAQNAVGARKFIDFMLSQQVQSQIPEQMYMYPADPSVKLPADWETYAAKVAQPYSLPTDQINANRDKWIKAWSAAVIG